MIRIRQYLMVLFVMVSVSAVAQDELMIEGITSGIHLSHTVASKENWYSIGRLYNISPKELAAYNKLTIDKPLGVSQVIKVPLTNKNFSQNEVKAADEVFVPVYHTIQEKEWMYRISVNYNKVPIEKLEKWNNISRDQAKAGTKLVVGFLRVKEGQSALAGGPAEKNAVAASTPKKDAAITPPTSQPIPKEVPKKEAATEVGNPTTTSIPKKEPSTDINNNGANVPKKEAASENSSEVIATSNSTAAHRGGYFKSLYDNSGKTSSGVSGIFKSTSGWNDGKYYALMNNVQVGTVVKVSFPSTNKSIYAKVLGQLPEMRESTGLAIRISDAAASELGAGNSKFTVDINY